MLKAYIDDSNMRQPPFYVLGGWFAPAHVWAKFSDAWRDILWMRPRIEYFKYSEAMNLTGQFGGFTETSRNEKLRLLVNLIEEYPEIQGASSVIPHNVFAPVFGDLPHKTMRNPYYISFFGIVAYMALTLHNRQSAEKIEFIFDYQPGSDSMKEVQEGWDDFRKLAPPQFLKYVQNHSPTFLDDKDVVALQAADLHAGWTREQLDLIDRRLNKVPPWHPSGSKIITYSKSWDPENLCDIFETAFGVRPQLMSYTFRRHGYVKPSEICFVRSL